MGAMELEPQKSLYFAGVKEWLVKEEDHARLKNILRLTCLETTKLKSQQGTNR